MKFNASIVAVFIFAVFVQAAQAVPSFKAVCEQADVKTFRHTVDDSGTPVHHEWTDGEKFAGPWIFSYEGGDRMMIDNRPAYVTGDVRGVLVAVQPESTSVAAGIWTYAIHIPLRMITASQVHGYDDPGFPAGSREIKARALSFRCLFSGVEE